MEMLPKIPRKFGSARLNQSALDVLWKSWSCLLFSPAILHLKLSICSTIMVNSAGTRRVLRSMPQLQWTCTTCCFSPSKECQVVTRLINLIRFLRRHHLSQLSWFSTELLPYLMSVSNSFFCRFVDGTLLSKRFFSLCQI